MALALGSRLRRPDTCKRSPCSPQGTWRWPYRYARRASSASRSTPGRRRTAAAGTAAETSAASNPGAGKAWVVRRHSVCSVGHRLYRRQLAAASRRCSGRLVITRAAGHPSTADDKPCSNRPAPSRADMGAFTQTLRADVDHERGYIRGLHRGHTAAAKPLITLITPSMTTVISHSATTMAATRPLSQGNLRESFTS